MKLLSLDSSGKTAAVAVTEDGALIGSSFSDSGFTHSQTLMPMIDALLRECGVGISEIDEFAFTNGPGSFTGLRIGAALMMGLAGDRPCRPVPTLDALAYNMRDKTGAIVTVLDSGRDRVYMAGFVSDGEKIVRLMADVEESVPEIVVRTVNYPGDLWFVGDGAFNFRFLEHRENVHIAEGEALYPQGLGVALAAEHVKPLPASKTELNYLRIPQAEAERRKRNENKHGL